MRKRIITLVVVCISALLPLNSANAWIIEQVNPAPGSGLAEAVVVDFHSTADTDMIEIHKYFLPDFEVDTMSIILEFTKEASDAGIDTLWIVDEIILNMTGVDWSDYHVVLLSSPDDGDAVTFIEPSWAAMPAPTRPATIRAVSTGPSSRTALAPTNRPI